MTHDAVDWPLELESTPKDERSRTSPFSVSLAKAVSDLETELDRLDPDDWTAEFGNNHAKSNGMPRHNANPDDPAFVLRWVDGGQQHAIGCDYYTSLRDNVRMVGQWVKETRMRAQRPVATAQDNFAAAALPPGEDAPDDPLGGRDPHEVLSVAPDAPEAVVEAAYKARVKDVHPDNGGSEQAFKRVRVARERLVG